MISLEYLVKNGVQFGHQSWRICPKMLPFVWGEKNGVHLIDVSKTANRIEKASQFLEEVAARGEPILWVGTKKAAQPVIEQAAQQLDAPYVSNRWIGGTLTNYSEVKKAIAKLKHYESLLEHSEKMYTKKEYGQFRKVVDRVEENVGGIRNISWPIGALVVVDAKKEQVAVKEAIKAGVPVVALVDTNTDPTGIDYVIPGNDDISRAIRVVIDPLVEAVQRGMKKAEEVAQQKRQAQQQQEQEQASEQGEETSASDDQSQEQETSAQNDTQAAQAEEEQAQQTSSAAGEEATSKSKQSTKQKTQSQASSQQASGEKKTTQASSSQKKATSSTKKQQTTKSSSATSKQSSTGTKSSSRSTTSSTSKKTTSQSSSQSASSATKKSSTAEKNQSAATGDDDPVAAESEEQ